MNLAAQLQLPIFKTVGEVADDLGYETYVVGGFVRDLFLKRGGQDIDFVCVGSGVKLAKAVHERLGGKLPFSVFKTYGTAMIKNGAQELEFVGARKESYQRESRKPMVEEGTLDDDQKRRDFTINAMAIRLNKEYFGELIDPFSGLEDLKEKWIKTPLTPEQTFSDDPLRMMRAIRFATQLKFDIDPDCFEGLMRMKERIGIVSKERIAVELNKIILSDEPSYGFKLLFQAGILEEIFPEMVALHGVTTIDDKSHKDNFYHTLQVLDNISQYTDSLWLRWAAILHDIAKPATKRFNKKTGWTFHGHEDKGSRMVPAIFRRMKLPMGAQMKYVQKMVRLHLRPIALVKDETTDAAIRRVVFEAGEDIDDLMTLCRADITSKNNHKVKRFLSNFDKVEKRIQEVEAKDKVRIFQPVITGKEIMNTFALSPGKEVGELKEALKEAVLDGEIKNEYEDAMAFLLKMGKERGLNPNHIE